MNKIKNLTLLIAAIIFAGFSACNYSSECWYYGEGSENAGADSGAGPGGGVIIPTGPSGVGGGYGDAPPRQPQDATGKEPELKCNSDETDDRDAEGSPESPKSDAPCTEADIEAAFWSCDDADTCSLKCAPSGVNAGPFGVTAFKFVTIVPDDGMGKGGGWQEALANLKIMRLNYGIFPDPFYCPIRVGMPLRTTLNGPISPDQAAIISTRVANQVARRLKKEEPDLPQGIFCFTLRTEMDQIFKKDHTSLGAKVN